MEEELKRLRRENEALREQNQSLREQMKALQEQLSVALAQIEAQKKKEPPAFVKANVSEPKKEGPRKKRAKEHNGARKREAPTRIEEHMIRTCPDCQGDLSALNVSRRRQIIELPPPPPVEVTEYRVYKGWCPSCKKWNEAPFDLPSGQVMGQGRLGVRISSLIAYLRTVMRLPIRQVQSCLHILHGLTISTGEIVEIQHRIKKQTKEVVQGLKAQVRASPAVQADETSWRENGKNGYIWSVNTPTIRYYEYHHSRGGAVVKELLGESYEGVIGSDFYAGYNVHLGLHQRYCILL